MAVRINFDLEKAELGAVLASEIFAKSPNLSRTLQYIGQKFLEGEEQLLKEYNIGVEALGRAPEFDPKTDSIVRVEAHRLREKLKRYYETEGSDHPVMITLHVGYYVPQFVRRNELTERSVNRQVPVPSPEMPGAGANGDIFPAQTLPLVATLDDSALATTSKLASRVRPTAWRTVWPNLLVALGSVVIIAVTVLALVRSKPQTGTVAAPQPAKAYGAVATDDAQSVRIIAGYTKKEYVDRLGKTWGPDRYFTGGEALVEPPVFIARAADSTLFATARQGVFSYDIPLKQGVFELRLYFVETDYGPGTLRGGGETSRLFHLDINGKRVQTDFDVLSDAGGTAVADERVYKDVAPAPDGYLHLNFTKAIDYPLLNAIEIVPGLPHQMLPVRIVAQEHSYTDEAGRLWSPDRYYYGGRFISHPQIISGTPDPGLYSGERYGHFDYVIPVAEGHYALELFFAETYFGPSNPGRAGAGSRVFDVYCNGDVLVRNLDIFKEAGGENRALTRTFHGLKPNALGKLMVSFVPVTN